MKRRSFVITTGLVAVPGCVSVEVPGQEGDQSVGKDDENQVMDSTDDGLGEYDGGSDLGTPDNSLETEHFRNSGSLGAGAYESKRFPEAQSGQLLHGTVEFDPATGHAMVFPRDEYFAWRNNQQAMTRFAEEGTRIAVEVRIDVDDRFIVWNRPPQSSIDYEYDLSLE